MDNANNKPSLVSEVVRSGPLAEAPFVLVDVGCGLGIDPVWRLFEPNLHAYGIDPQLSEVERLRREERNPDVHYHAALVGLPRDDEFHKRRADDARCWSAYFHPLARSSGFLATERAKEAGGRYSGGAEYLDDGGADNRQARHSPTSFDSKVFETSTSSRPTRTAPTSRFSCPP